MGWDPSKWNIVEHLAVWPLATLILLITLGFVWMAITDPTMPDTEPAMPKDSKPQQGEQNAAPRHRA